MIKYDWEAINGNWGELAIVIQPVALLHLGTSYDRLATADGWMQWAGLTYQHSFVSAAMFNCMVLEEARWEISEPTQTFGLHVFTDINSMLKDGVAVHIIDLDNSYIHTYAPEEGSPGAPQNNDPPRFGEYDIVKCYRTYNETTGEYTDDGTTSRTSCINKVSVDDEPEYKIVQWDTSGSTNTGMSSLSYNPPAIQHGETSKVVKLDKTEGEKCIYVLLERRISEEVEEEDYNYLLPQSRINKKIK